MEPNLPKPLLWVAGITPIAGALVELGAAWLKVTLFDPIADAAAFPAAAAVRADTNLVAVEREASLSVIVWRPRASGTRRPWPERCRDAR